MLIIVASIVDSVIGGVPRLHANVGDVVTLMSLKAGTKRRLNKTRKPQHSSFCVQPSLTNINRKLPTRPFNSRTDENNNTENLNYTVRATDGRVGWLPCHMLTTDNVRYLSVSARLFRFVSVWLYAFIGSIFFFG
jgi:hypothetical protein